MSTKIEKREHVGTSAARKVRREQLVPATLFGSDIDAVSVSINRKELEEVIRSKGENAVFDVSLNGKTHKVILAEIQRAALKNEVYSVSLHAVNASDTLTVEVPIVLQDGDKRSDGVLDQHLLTITVEAKPDAIPSEITVDTSKLTVGETITVEELPKIDGVTYTTEAGASIAGVSPFRSDKELESSAGQEELVEEVQVVGEEE
ncbi:50S ribosomal protein L25 [Granulicatella seriolae]|uniref:Large ribosomal subunit protein bL25 n=1 Tax=Granulicatella seriolae TaxID=2967226 RepID=A0ABT1WKT5_9LACT|nr:50S ribosomal protein L25 [Granulicatella seriolae]